MCRSFRRASPRLQKRLKRNTNMVSKWGRKRLLQFHRSTSFDRSNHRILFLGQLEAEDPHIYPSFNRTSPLTLESTITWRVVVLTIRKQSPIEISLTHLIDHSEHDIQFLHETQGEDPHIYPSFDGTSPIILRSARTWLVLVFKIRKRSPPELLLVKDDPIKLYIAFLIIHRFVSRHTHMCTSKFMTSI